MPEPTCVFCTRTEQPRTLFETPSLYVMPDKYPTVPGHVLIIAEEHLRCYADASPAVAAELEVAAARARLFLADTYRSPALVFENGIAGQSVFHAHLHVLPAGVTRLPAEILDHPDVQPVEDWEGVRQYFSERGPYRYVELGGSRYVLPGYSPALPSLRRMLSEAAGLEWGSEGQLKTATPQHVRETEQRWAVRQER